MENKNNKKNLSISIFFVIVVIALVSGSTYAYWTWFSTNNKQIEFSSSEALSKYIEYDSGTAKFIGDFQPCNNYYDGIYTTVSANKKTTASDIPIYGTLYMDISTIDSYLSTYSGLKWVVTKGDNTSRVVLNQGDFIDKVSGSNMIIYDDIELTTTKELYTVWIWVDESINPTEDISKKKVETNIWMHLDQAPRDL